MHKFEKINENWIRTKRENPIKGSRSIKISEVTYLKNSYLTIAPSEIILACNDLSVMRLSYSKEEKNEYEEDLKILSEMIYNN